MHVKKKIFKNVQLYKFIKPKFLVAKCLAFKSLVFWGYEMHSKTFLNNKMLEQNAKIRECLECQNNKMLR